MNIWELLAQIEKDAKKIERLAHEMRDPLGLWGEKSFNEIWR